MAAITIRKLPDEAKQRLRMRAAAHGRSMESEARDILMDALAATGHADLSWVEQLIAVGHELGGVDVPEVEDEVASAAELRPR